MFEGTDPWLWPGPSSLQLSFLADTGFGNTPLTVGED